MDALTSSITQLYILRLALQIKLTIANMACTELKSTLAEHILDCHHAVINALGWHMDRQDLESLYHSFNVYIKLAQTINDLFPDLVELQDVLTFCSTTNGQFWKTVDVRCFVLCHMAKTEPLSNDQPSRYVTTFMENYIFLLSQRKYLHMTMRTVAQEFEKKRFVECTNYINKHQVQVKKILTTYVRCDKELSDALGVAMLLARYRSNYSIVPSDKQQKWMKHPVYAGELGGYTLLGTINSIPTLTEYSNIDMSLNCIGYHMSQYEKCMEPRLYLELKNKILGEFKHNKKKRNFSLSEGATDALLKIVQTFWPASCYDIQSNRMHE